mmetsp:Transcript_41001/g.85559  ORF Transcript_41001/g.85559 Transcript_41001/m.85559 type:complete len:1077 (-) Transcript_41001:1365-4595(-)
MRAQGRAGPPSPARGGVGPRATTIASPPCAPENPVLQRVRGNRLLDQMRHSDSTLQVRRTARLLGDMAAITSVLTMNLCDMMFRFYSGQSEAVVRHRHRTSLQAIEIINDLCTQPLVLREWGFSEEHCRVAAVSLGSFTGFAGVQFCPPDPSDLRAALPQPAQIDEAPFLNSILFLLLSKDFPALALIQCLARARFGTWSADYRTFFPERRPGQGLEHRWAIQTTKAQDLGTVCVTFVGADIDSFRFEAAWPRARFRHGSCRHFMSERFRLQAVDDTRPDKFKVFRTVRASDGLQHAKPFWYRYFGDISAELETILDGTFTVAKNGLPLRPIFQRNHPSWEDDAYAQRVLMPVVTEWHNAGSLEYVERLHRLPHCILAVGAVPKNSPPLRRLVTDARPINIYAERWRVMYTTVQDICLMLTLCALMWVRDLCNAYHLVRLGGCRGRTRRLLRWITNPDGTGYVPAPTFQSGCGPGDCLGLCDKSMFGLCIEGHVSRFAVCQFGHKVSNGPLWVLTSAVCSYESRNHGVDAQAFVDDLFKSLAVLIHDLCGGLEDSCPVCMAALEEAKAKMEFLDRMMKQCGLEYSTKGDMRILQRHLFIGIIFDTLKGRIFISKEKFDKTMALLRDLMQQAECSSREMAKLRGKFGHQFRCVEGVNPFLVPFNQFVGAPETVAEWDEPKPISHELRQTMGTLFRWLPQLYEAGAEMWPLDPRTVFYKWSQGIETPGGPLIVVYWDSSPLAVGISIRRNPGSVWKTGGMTYKGATTIATFGTHLEHQVHRESAGGPLAMQIVRSLADIRGHRVLFVNDCLPVVLAMRKGSPSPQLQSDAEYMALSSLESGCKSLYLHVPGTKMIAAGVDGAGREGARRIVGPTCSEQGRAKIRSMLAQHGWVVTIDLFAAACNRFTARFASWTDEPESEVVDAFTVPSWDQSVCVCGSVHRETAFIFPPRGLEKAVVRRAKSDGVRAAFVVPTAYKAGYWEALRGRAVAQLQLSDPASDFAHAQAPLGDHTLFLVDFNPSDSGTPACGQECKLRGRRERFNPVEREERAWVQAELLRLEAEQAEAARTSTADLPRQQ